MTQKILSIFILVYSLFPTFSLQSQGLPEVKQAERDLCNILNKVKESEFDSIRSELNSRFSFLLEKTIHLPESDSYPFDSIKSLVKLTSPDNKFRLYQWNIPTTHGNFRYFTLIKIFNPISPKIISLTDFHDSIPYPDSAHLDQKHWYGALYYKIIPCNSDGVPYYTVLGWAGQNTLITQKVIDVIYFDSLGIIKFGLPVFPDYKKGLNTRIVFRYSATTSMTLKVQKNIILFDRLVPLDPQLENQFQFFVPSGEVADSFVYENHHWHFIPGIEAKNHK